MKILYISNDEVSHNEVKQYLGKEDEVICADGALEGISLTGIYDFDFILLDKELKNYSSRVVSKHINPKIPKGYYTKTSKLIESLDMAATKATEIRSAIAEAVHNWSPVAVS